MALFPCPDCGNQVSDRANSCPKCGAPLQPVSSPPPIPAGWQPPNPSPPQFPPAPKTSGCAKVVLVFILFLVFVVVVAQCSTPTPPAASTPAITPANSAPATPATTPSEQLAGITSTWDPAGEPSAKHADIASALRGFITRQAGTPEARQAAALLPLVEAKAKAHAENAQLAIAAAKWLYQSDTDAMTDDPRYFASLESENTISLDFPYQGSQRGTLTLREDSRNGLNVIFRIERGQVLCTSYDGCTVRVRFDDNEPQRWHAVGPSDHSTESVFLNNERAFLAAMTKAKTVRISVEIYQSGSPTFEFDVGGFRPERFKPANYP